MSKVLMIVFFSIALFSCNQDCKECYVVTGQGTTNENIMSQGEKCGPDLEAFDTTVFVDITGAQIPSYCQ